MGGGPFLCDCSIACTSGSPEADARIDVQRWATAWDPLGEPRRISVTMRGRCPACRGNGGSAAPQGRQPGGPAAICNTRL